MLPLCEPLSINAQHEILVNINNATTRHLVNLDFKCVIQTVDGHTIEPTYMINTNVLTCEGPLEKPRGLIVESLLILKFIYTQMDYHII